MFAEVIENEYINRSDNCKNGARVRRSQVSIIH